MSLFSPMTLPTFLYSLLVDTQEEGFFEMTLFAVIESWFALISPFIGAVFLMNCVHAKLRLCWSIRVCLYVHGSTSA